MGSGHNSEHSQWSSFLEQWGFFPLTLVAFLTGLVLSFFFHGQGNTPIHLLDGAIFFMLAGVGLICIAEFSKYRSRHFSLGHKPMPPELKRYYRWGWGFFLAGILLCFYLLFSHHQSAPPSL